MKIKIIVVVFIISVVFILSENLKQQIDVNENLVVDESINISEFKKAPDDFIANRRNNIESLVIDAHVLSPITKSTSVTYRTNSPDLQGELTVMEEPEPKKEKGKRYVKANPDDVTEYITSKSSGADYNRSLVSSFDAGGQVTNTVNNGGFLFIPADPHGAAGPNHVVNVFNTSIEFYNKDGTGGVSTSLQSFFAPLSPANFTFDPKVLYDQFENRWIVVTLQRTVSPNTSNVFIAVSDDDDPNGTWYMTDINTRFSPMGDDSWFDYPGLAIDEEVIYLTGNMFTFAANAGRGSYLWLIEKSAFYANLAPTVNGPLDPYAGGGSSTTTQPAHVYGTAPAGMGTYLVSYSRISNGVQEFWQTVRIDTPLGIPGFVQEYILIGDIEPNGSSLPDAPQAGTSTDTNSSFTIQTNDPRALDAVWRNDMLYTTATIESQTALGETTASWFSFMADGSAASSVDQFGLIDGEDIAPNTFTFFPSIAVNADGGIALGYSASSATTNPGSYYAFRSPTDASNTMRSSQVLRAGTDFYYRTFGGGSNRWGDYTAMTVDPNDECFWVYNKHAVSRGVSTGSDEDGLYESAFGEVCNQAPVGNDDTAMIDPGVTFTTVNGGDTSVLTNDTDADSDDTLSAVIVTSPNSASAFNLNSNGSFSYTHNSDFATSDSFIYNVCDDGTPAKCDQGTVNITINQPDQPPTAVNDSFTVDEDSGLANHVVIGNDLNADGGPINIIAVGAASNGTAAQNGNTIDYTPADNYCEADSFTYTLNGNSQATVSVTVTCIDDNPTAVNDGFTVDEDSGLANHVVINNDTDIDAGPLNIIAVGAASNGTATQNGNTIDYTPADNYCGADSFTYTLNGNSQATVSVTVTCIDDIPTAVNDGFTVDEDSGLANHVVIGNDLNADGGPINIIAVGAASNGTAAQNGNTIDYTPADNYCGADSFTYTLNGNSQATVSVTVTCIDDNPTAVNDGFTVDEDSGLANHVVINNDTDIDAGPLNIIAVGAASNGTATQNGNTIDYTPADNYCGADGFTYTLNGNSQATVSVTVTCIDDIPTAVNDGFTVDEDSGLANHVVIGNDLNADGGPINIIAVGAASNGTAAQNGNTIDYTPADNYCGADSFTYTLNGNSQATISVTVTCIDDNPVAVNDGFTVDEDSGLANHVVINNDTDIDAGPLNIIAVGAASNGTAAQNGNTIDYTPADNYCGADSFTYTLNGNSQATVSVTVTCIDDNPTAVNDGFTVDEDSGLANHVVINNDTDIDAGPLNIIAVGAASNGTATQNGNTIDYTPVDNYCGADSFTYTLNGNSQATVSVTVTCIDDNPTAVNDGFTVDEDSGLANHVVINNDTDIDAGPLNIIAVGAASNGTAAQNGNTIDYTPADNYCGADSFTYTLNGNSQATVSVTVTCIDDNPTAVNDGFTVDEDSGLANHVVINNDTDIDAGPLNIIAVGAASNGTATQNGNTIDYTPADNYCGADSFTYTLNGNSQATVSVTVSCINDQPSMAVNENIYIGLDQLGNLPVQNIACQINLGAGDENNSQNVNDMNVSIQNDTNGILTSIDVSNSGQLIYSFTGNSGVAEVSITLQDDGGMMSGGVDTSVIHTFNVNVQDYVFRNGFDTEVCQ